MIAAAVGIAVADLPDGDASAHIAESERTVVYSAAIHAMTSVLDQWDKFPQDGNPATAFERELVKLGFIYWANSISEHKCTGGSTYVTFLFQTNLQSYLSPGLPFYQDPLFLGSDFFDLQTDEQAAILDTRLEGEPVAQAIIFDKQEYAKQAKLYFEWVGYGKPRAKRQRPEGE